MPHLQACANAWQALPLPRLASPKIRTRSTRSSTRSRKVASSSKRTQEGCSDHGADQCFACTPRPEAASSATGKSRMASHRTQDRGHRDKVGEHTRPLTHNSAHRYRHVLCRRRAGKRSFAQGQVFRRRLRCTRHSIVRSSSRLWRTQWYGHLCCQGALPSTDRGQERHAKLCSRQSKSHGCF